MALRCICRRLLMPLLGVLAGIVASAGATADPWLTRFERSGGTETPRYDETIAYCRRLADASPWVRMTSFGVSPQGRPLPLMIVSRHRAFSPAAARKRGDAVVLIQCGIHAGEIDGKDACLMMVRDMVIRARDQDLLDHALLLIVPIFNVDGHERFGPWNRINQLGPKEMGWRVTSQNLNLNRDYMKADAPEMRAMLHLFQQWLPDLLIDCHVTDGIDMQYDVTYSAETGRQTDPAVAAWVRDVMLPTALPEVERAGHRVFSYVFPREDRDLTKGLEGSAAEPRFSTGFAAAQNRPAVLIETHMLKSFALRVDATRAFLRGILRAVETGGGRLRAACREADARATALGAGADRPFLALRFGVTPVPTMVEFLGVESRMDSSSVSGGRKQVYTGKPVTMRIPFYDQIVATESVAVPLAYCVPREWGSVLDVLRAHGVTMVPLRREVVLPVESYRFDTAEFRQEPYEGRTQVSVRPVPLREERRLRAGTMVVPCAQRLVRVIVHLLDPHGPDALLGWGFWNAIFEQKEYAEQYVMEAVADTMLRGAPALRDEYLRQVAADTAFARSPERRLNWLYRHSRWADPLHNVYPVSFVADTVSMRVLLEATRSGGSRGKVVKKGDQLPSMSD